MTVLVVALNPALDLTYEVDTLRPGATNRVRQVRETVGGKPLNVARLLGRLGIDVTVIGLAPADLVTLLDRRNDPTPLDVWVPVLGAARRTVAVVDQTSGQVTSFNEPGPAVAVEDWDRVVDAVRSGLRDPVDAVVLSGSLPPGLPVDAYATLVGEARAAGCFVALDTDGPAFAPALAAGPDLVKPNVEELAAVGWPDVDDHREALAAAVGLRARGAGAAVVSLGARGLVAATDDGCWAARGPAVSGNPTGAGDAVVAGLVASTVRGLPWIERLRHGAALGAAAAAEPVAGTFDPQRYERLLAATQAKLVQKTPDSGVFCTNFGGGSHGG